MLQYILRRLLIMIPTLFGISLITFVIINLSPMDPLAARQGGAMSKRYVLSKEYMEKQRRLFHLDKPIPMRYLLWLRRMVTLDFGESWQDSRPVIDKVLERMPLTLYLNLVSFAMIFLISVPLGSYAALKRGQPFDKVTGNVVFVLYSLPIPWVALMLLIYAGVEWNLLPITGIVSDDFSTLGLFGKLGDIISHSILPVMCLTYGGLAFLTKLTRTSVLEVINQDYIRAALARGLQRREVLFRHGLKNALIPIITVFGALFPTLISGSVIIERIFTLPGMGQLFFESILNVDRPTIMALSVLSAVLTLLGILLADILYAVVDPRISYGGRA